MDKTEIFFIMVISAASTVFCTGLTLYCLLEYGFPVGLMASSGIIIAGMIFIFMFLTHVRL